MSWTPDLAIGDMRRWPTAVRVVRGRTGETRRYVPETSATRIIRTRGAIGRCNCSACGWRIDPYDRFCRRCGARLNETRYEREDE